MQGVGAKDPFTAESAIEEKCKEGLSTATSGLLFCGPEEKDADNFVACFRALREIFKKHGLDGI